MFGLICLGIQTAGLNAFEKRLIVEDRFPARLLLSDYSKLSCVAKSFYSYTGSQRQTPLFPPKENRRNSALRELSIENLSLYLAHFD
jgi:hypothetical protein